MSQSNDKNERQFPICKDHTHADWNQPELDGGCVLCRLFYLEAQESLLEEWQQRAKRSEGAIEEIQRPLDAQMARLNATVARLNEENERLRSAPSAIKRHPDAIISKIILDIRDRQGLGDEWDNIDVDVRKEIIAEWRSFFNATEGRTA